MKTFRILSVLVFALLVTVTGVSAQTKKPTKKSTTGTKTTSAKTKTKPKAKPAVVQTKAEAEPVVIAPQPAPVQMVQQPAPQPVATNQPQAEKGTDGLNPNSARPIPDADVMYKVTNWRRMDLREKINQPFFSKNNEITKYLLDGVRAGLLKAYANDSLTTELSMEKFNTNLMYDNTEGGLSDEEKAAGFGGTPAAGKDDGWGTTPAKGKDPKAPATTAKKPATAQVDDGWGGTTAAKKPAAGQPQAGAAKTDAAGWGDDPAVGAAGGPVEYFPKELTVLEIKEDYIFDKKRSRAYNDIQALTIIIPAEKTAKGFDVPVASFRYKDVANYFRSNPSKFIWYNSMNQAQHKNMADAFDLRLFSARLIKQSNANDSYLTDIYEGEKAGLIKSQQLEHKLMEYEHNLWEY